MNRLVQISVEILTVYQVTFNCVSAIFKSQHSPGGPGAQREHWVFKNQNPFTAWTLIFRSTMLQRSGMLFRCHFSSSQQNCQYHVLKERVTLKYAESTLPYSLKPLSSYPAISPRPVLHYFSEFPRAVASFVWDPRRMLENSPSHCGQHTFHESKWVKTHIIKTRHGRKNTVIGS